MCVLRISLLGRFHVHCDDQVMTGLDALKVQELFCYLLLYRDHPHRRETLASMLWGDSLTAQSKKNLRQILWHLQTTLAPYTGPTDGHVLVVEPEWVRFNSESSLWLDVSMFEQAAALTHGVSGRDLDIQQAQALQEAVQLYRGDLLEGWYQDWCLYERERLQNVYLTMLDKLMGYCEAQDQYEAGLDYGARILRHDRARERTHWQMMRLYYLAGDRTGALRQYQRCVAALDEELGVKPAARTVALYEQIRADQPRDPALAPGETSAAFDAVTLPQVLEHLSQIQRALADVQDQVQQHIDAVKRTLNGPP